MSSCKKILPFCIAFVLAQAVMVSQARAESYTYDSAGRLTGAVYDDGSRIAYSYDSAGNIVQQQATENRPPNAFDLVYPMDGQTGVSASPTLIWKNAVDPDGDAVSYEVTYCEDATFTGCTPQPVALTTPNTIPSTRARMAAAAGLFVLLMLFAGSSSVKGRATIRTWLALVLLATFLTGATACGGGSGGRPDAAAPPTPAADETGFTATGLAAGTTYHWKVTASDPYGGSTDSATWSFTTQ